MIQLSCVEFSERVGKLDYFELKKLPEFSIESPSMTGCFYVEDLEYLISYCEKFPEFHICTTTNDIVYHNRLLKDGFLFFLCKGDQDPELFSPPDFFAMGKIFAVLMGIVRGEATLAELNELKNSFDTSDT